MTHTPYPFTELAAEIDAAKGIEEPYRALAGVAIYDKLKVIRADAEARGDKEALDRIIGLKRKIYVDLLAFDAATLP